MAMISKSTLGLCAGVAGAIFLGYCIYFDKKRHSDPNFKRKLREKRRTKAKSSSSGFKWPDLNDHDAVQKFFFSQVQLGEELLSQGEVQAGVQHLARAVTVCGQPQQLLQVLQQTLPPQVFTLLIQTLPSVGATIAENMSEKAAKVAEDDVE